MAILDTGTFLLWKIPSVILWLLRVVRRAFCCFRIRGNHQHLDDATECLTHIGVVPNRNQEENWSAEWGEEQKNVPQTVGDHIQNYRSRLNTHHTPDPNHQALETMFQELEPQVIKQKKVIIGYDKKDLIDDKKSDTSRLSAVNNFSSELGEWMEESASGWDEQQLNPADFVRQQKRVSQSRSKLHTTKLAT